MGEPEPTTDEIATAISVVANLAGTSEIVVRKIARRWYALSLLLSSLLSAALTAFLFTVWSPDRISVDSWEILHGSGVGEQCSRAPGSKDSAPRYLCTRTGGDGGR